MSCSAIVKARKAELEYCIYVPNLVRKMPLKMLPESVPLHNLDPEATVYGVQTFMCISTDEPV